MFFKLERNRNYSYLFIAIVGLSFFSGFVFGMKIGLLILFSSIDYLGVMQLYSGIAINKSSCVAQVEKEKEPTLFYAIILSYFVLGTLGLILILFGRGNFQP
jgi:hypothetical protein